MPIYMKSAQFNIKNSNGSFVPIDSIYGTIANSSETNYCTPEMYGAVGDGISDDTDALQTAFSSGLPVYLSKKYLQTRRISATSVNIFGTGEIYQNITESIEFPLVFSGEYFIINGPTFTADSDSNGRTILSLQRAHDIKICCCTFNALSGSAAQRNCLDLYTDTQYINIDNCTFNQVCDMNEGGIWVRESSTNKVTENITFNNCNFKKIGCDEVLAVWSWKGLVRNVFINNCIFKQIKGTNNPSMLITLGQHSPKTENIVMDGCYVEAEYLGESIFFMDSYADVIIQNCKIVGETHTSASAPFLTIYRSEVNGKPFFKNCDIISKNSLATLAQHSIFDGCNILWEDASYAFNLFLSCDIKNCYINYPYACGIVSDGGNYFINNKLHVQNGIGIVRLNQYATDSNPSFIFMNNEVDFESGNINSQSIFKNVSHIINNRININGSGVPQLFYNEGVQYTSGNIINITQYDETNNDIETEYRNGNIIQGVSDCCNDIITLLASLKTALENSQTDEAINLLDTFLLDHGSLE